LQVRFNVALRLINSLGKQRDELLGALDAVERSFLIHGSFLNFVAALRRSQVQAALAASLAFSMDAMVSSIRFKASGSNDSGCAFTSCRELGHTLVMSALSILASFFKPRIVLSLLQRIAEHVAWR
jgi:hypothetical protein